MLTLEYFNAVEAEKVALLQAIKAKFSTTITVDDLAWGVKSLEIRENIEHIPEYQDILALIPVRSTELLAQPLSSQSIMLIARANKLGAIPYGKEDRWRLLHEDEMNVDIKGQIVVGHRTLESFGDKILEQYYT